MEPVKSNLEPIDESDLDLEKKFKSSVVDFSHHQEAIPIPKAEHEAPRTEREMPKEIIASEKDSAYGKILSKVQAQTQSFDPATIASDAQTGAQMTDAESQIQHLIDIAQQKGVVHAVKVAQHMQDNYVLDTFHDKMLVDELHNALVMKGMITEL